MKKLRIRNRDDLRDLFRTEPNARITVVIWPHAISTDIRIRDEQGDCRGYYTAAEFAKLLTIRRSPPDVPVRCTKCGRALKPVKAKKE